MVTSHGGNSLWYLMTFKIGQVSDVLKTQGAQLVLPVAILHIAAFALGYWISKISFGESTSRTISIECGMQVNFFSMSLFLPIFLMIFTINTMIVYMKIFSSHILFPLPHKKKKKLYQKSESRRIENNIKWKGII